MIARHSKGFISGLQVIFMYQSHFFYKKYFKSFTKKYSYFVIVQCSGHRAFMYSVCHVI